MSHRVPFEWDFEGEIQGPAWESGQAGGVIQIPKGIAFSWVESSNRQWGGAPCACEGESTVKRCRWRGKSENVSLFTP
jgi:hypothetical protein